MAASDFPHDLRDVRFNLFDMARVHELCDAPRFEEFDRELFDSVLLAARDQAAELLWPLNAVGDTEKARFIDGGVRMPEGWKKVYDQYVASGWNGLTVEPELGGQGMPGAMMVATQDFFLGANTSFSFTPGLTTGALRMVAAFGTEAQKATYLEKMISGEWSGTMALTEPHAGTAVPDLKSTATPIAADDPLAAEGFTGEAGFFRIKGQKIFISSADHDLTDNIVNMVLARVAGDPPGAKGVSLFIVPRYRPTSLDAKAGVGAWNDITTMGIEHKMGIHASPTCALSFGDEGDCVGWLLGRQGEGLSVMFQMMNEARISVGAQAMGMAQSAYGLALAYAKERRQGVRLEQLKDLDAERVAIIEHADVRRMLVEAKALTEGCRALVYHCAICHDRSVVARDAGDEHTAQRWEHQLEVLTPIVKAWTSDEAFRVTELAVQVHGGYGYIHEYGVEQIMRDVKIASIYEGTNGIQALDLVGRKIARGGGVMMMTTLNEVNRSLGRDDVRGGTFAAEAKALAEVRDLVAKTAMGFAMRGNKGDVQWAALHATSFLEMFGDLLVGWLLVEHALVAEAKLSERLGDRASDRDAIAADAEATFLHGKLTSARFFVNHILPRAHARARAMDTRDRSPLEAIL